MTNPEKERALRRCGGQLSMLRSRLNRTQEQAAEAIGISHRSLKGWESGSTCPSAANLQKLIQVYLSEGAFTKGHEAEEVEQLWEMVPFSAEFDQAWFARLQTNYLAQTTSVDTQENQTVTQAEQETLPQASVPIDNEEASVPFQETRPVRKQTRDRNRQYLLEQVSTTWIEGVLEQSLQSIVHISLGLHEQPDATNNPWTLHVQEMRQSSRPLAPGMQIAHIYDQMHGKLLILGEPGSGKTALLLELTRDLIERAKNDESYLLPVVFNLSSWSIKQLPVTDWLVEELNEKYLIPHALAQSLVENNQLILLLDGLDEVEASSRDDCLGAINRYRREHGPVPMVVCSRSEEYLALTARLTLNSAIVIQPLTPQDIEDYFARAGAQLASLHAALQVDPDLRKLAENPLMLNILALTYQNMPADELAHTPQIRQQQIFETYIRRMFLRRHVTERYTNVRAIHWLSQLAHHMHQQNQSIFHLEYMQADWLAGNRLRWIYDLLGIRLISVLIGMLTNIMVNNLFGSSDIANATLYGFIGGMIGYLLSSKSADVSSPEPRFFQKLWQRFWRRGLPSGLLVASCVGLCWRFYLGALSGYGRSDWLHDWLVFGTGYGICGIILGTCLVGIHSPHTAAGDGAKPKNRFWNRVITARSLKSSLLVGFSLGLCTWACEMLSSPTLRAHNDPLIDGISDLLSFTITTLIISFILTETTQDIQPTESVVWLWRAFSNPKHLRNGALLGMFVALGLGTVYWVNFGARIGLEAGLGYGLGSALCYLILVGCLSSINDAILNRPYPIRPNEGMRRSARNSLIYGLISGCVSWVTCFACIMFIFRVVPTSDITLSPGLRPGPALALIFASVVGLSAGLAVCLLRGGIACIRHVLLRWILWKSRVMPWHYTSFLDYAVERVFLRKVGGGYIFIHRLLLEHFATLYNKTWENEKRVTDGA